MENQIEIKQNILAEVVDCLCDSEHGMLSWKGKGIDTIFPQSFARVRLRQIEY